MNTYNVNDINFVNSKIYKDFLNENASSGSLKIRAYAASGAIPVSKVKIIISKNIDGNNVIFYEGLTDSSGLIERIILPAPKLELNNLGIPKKTTYDVTTIYDNVKKVYKVNIYENICVVQNISVIPGFNIEGIN